jgi:solute carrier family 13 (sodium-dependent dicarboxylate transporter), member 2/3/5
LIDWGKRGKVNKKKTRGKNEVQRGLASNLFINSINKFTTDKNLNFFLKLIPIILVLIFYFFYPKPVGLEQAGWTAIAIFLITIYVWATELVHLSVAALITIFLLLLTGAVTPLTALYGFGSTSFFLIFIGFMVAIGMEAAGLDERIANEILKYCHTERSVILGIMIITAMLSMIMSNTTTVIMMIPIIRHMIAKTDMNKIAIFLSIAFSANVGGVGFLIGTPPNLLAANALGLGFTDWLVFGFPFMLIMLLLLYISFLIYFKPKHKIEKVTLDHLGFWSSKEKFAAVVVGLTVLLWLTSSWHGLSTLTVGLIGGLLMALFIYDWKFFTKKADWGVLIILAGAISIGKALEVTGAAQWMAERFLEMTGFESIWLIAFSFAILGLVITQFIQNTATAGIMIPVLVGISATLGVSAEKLVLPLTMAVSMTFMMPPGTAPNLLVYTETGISTKEFFKAGLLPTILGIVVVLFFCLIIGG